ncbi:hypothetical protein ACUH78_18040 [Thauera sp. ZXT1-4]|uniref:hypothetical protein n=1 Tax=Thauera sp. ZXT1-4 TaxID=3460294 RepID=UPI004040814E
MQRVQDAARLNYPWYVSGELSLEKWPSLEIKLSELYDCNLPKSTRSKRRKSGEAATLLYAVAGPQQQQPRMVRWIMAVSDGKGRVHAREKLLRFDAGDRCSFIGRYELVHDGVGWSWRMNKKRVEALRERIHEIAAAPPDRRQIRKDAAGEFDAEIEAVMDELYRAPGFRLMRRQVGKLVGFAMGEWRRLRPERGPQIRARTFLPYMTRRSNTVLRQDVP